MPLLVHSPGCIRHCALSDQASRRRGNQDDEMQFTSTALVRSSHEHYLASEIQQDVVLADAVLHQHLCDSLAHLLLAHKHRACLAGILHALLRTCHA